MIIIIAIIPAAIYRIYKQNYKYADEIPVFGYHRLCSGQYHRHIHEEKDLWTRVGHFEREMRWLHDNGYRTLSMDEFYSWYKGETELPKKSVVITFDDGYYNVIKYGLPIMKKYGIKATIFIIGNRTAAMQEHKDEFDYIAVDTMKKVKREYPNIDFQSHSYGLHSGDNMNADIFKKQYPAILADIGNQRRRFPGFDMRYIAYPFGYGTAKYTRAVDTCGYNLGFTYDDKRSARRSDQRYRIPRIGVRGDVGTDIAFYRWLRKD